MTTFSPEARTFASPQEEIAYLRSQIEEKERELEQSIESPTERRVKQDEASKELIRAYTQAGGRTESFEADEKGKIELNLTPEEHDELMSELAAIVEEKGVIAAMERVHGMGNPHVEDDFHRFLVQYLKGGYNLPNLKEKSPIRHALKMTLYEVVLASPEKEEGVKTTLKELVSAMEQLYAGLLHRDDKEYSHITVEMAVKHAGEDVSFYVSVPDAMRGRFEKQILSVFPDADVREIKDDFNIFNEEGASVGSYAVADEHAIFPLKVYEAFDKDPLSILLSAFSKLAEVGEGALVQFVIRPDKRNYIGAYREVIKEIEGGASVKKAIKVPVHTFGDELMGAAKILFSSDDKKKEDKEISELSRSAIEQIREKISSPIVEVNLNVIASAATKERANEIRDELESAFAQFENAQGASIDFTDVSEKKFASFAQNVSFRLFEASRIVPLNLTELTTLAHFPVTEMKGARELKQSTAVTAPVPLEMPKEGVVLGVNRHRGKEVEVRMTQKDRMRHMYVIGQTGTGKSVLLTNMIIQDIQNGDGCCFIDPHGSDVEDVLAAVPPERYEDVIYFDPSQTERPMALNMLEYDSRFPEQKTFVVNEMLGIFNKLFDMKTAGGPMFEQYFRNSVMLVMDDPESGNTLLDVSRVLADESYRALKLSRSNNPIIKQYWKEVAEKAGGEASLQNIVPYITSKFDVFLTNEIMRPIVAQEHSSLNFRRIMDEKKILLVNLSKGRLGDINANLLGLIIVGKLLMAALSRVDSFDRNLPPFYLYIDEFQNVTTDSISVILSEARKYNLSLTAAHQFIKQLQEPIRDAVFGNVGSMAAFRVSPEDAEVLEKQFAPVFTARDINNIPNWSAYVKILVNGVPAKPFSIATLPPPEQNAAHVGKLKELSFLTYGRPRAEVEHAIMEKYKTLTRAEGNL